MSWQTETTLIIRHLINDLEDTPTFSDERIEQLAVIAAKYVVQDMHSTKYTIDVVNQTISPDPSLTDPRDEDFLGLIALKSACLLDQTNFRLAAINEGIRTTLGPASLSVGGNLKGFKDILDVGPCKAYEQTLMDYNMGNTAVLKAILSPFVSNNFDPQNLMGGSGRGLI